MIIVGFIVDYIVMLLFPFNSYFILYELDYNKLFNVVIIGLLVDLLYGKFLFTILLVVIYFVLKKLRFKKKYWFIKNMLVFLIFFNISFFSYGYNLSMYLCLFIMGIVLHICYMLLIKMYK